MARPRLNPGGALAFLCDERYVLSVNHNAGFASPSMDFFTPPGVNGESVREDCGGE